MTVSDISKYQSRNIRPNVGKDAWDPANWIVEIDWDRFVPTAEAIVMRVGDGENKDPVFDRYFAAVTARTRSWGIYHLFRPEVSVKKQLDLIRSWVPMTPPRNVWGDLEFTGGKAGAELFNLTDAYLKGLDQLWAADAGIYSGAWFLDPNFSVARQKTWSHRPGWWSGYPNMTIPNGWESALTPYVLHQFTDKWAWPGVPKPADASRLNPAVTIEAMRQPPLGVPEPIDPDVVAVLENTDAIRKIVGL